MEAKAKQNEQRATVSKILDGSIQHDQLLTPAEVAQLFHVDPKTVTRWANNGKLGCIRTLGGHRRFRASVVYDALYGTDRKDDE